MHCPICESRLIETNRLAEKVMMCPEGCGEWISQGLMNRLTNAGPAPTELIQLGLHRPSPDARVSRQEDLFDWF